LLFSVTRRRCRSNPATTPEEETEMTTTISKWLSVGAALFALGTGSALAGDATADRARERAARPAPAQVAEKPATEQGSGSGMPCAKMDCCARMPVQERTAEFTDVG
jgi:hypothetical protein